MAGNRFSGRPKKNRNFREIQFNLDEETQKKTMELVRKCKRRDRI